LQLFLPLHKPTVMTQRKSLASRAQLGRKTIAGK
jgi:hypothetical protein